MITINWGNTEKTIMQYEFEGSWTIDDLVEALDSGVEVAERYDHPIDVIVDLTNSGFPNLFGTNVNKAFSKAQTRSEEHMANTDRDPGMVVIVTTNGIMRSSLSSMLALSPMFGGKAQLVVADTFDEAVSRINTFRRERVVA